MYNGFTAKKQEKDAELQSKRVRPLKERNPELAARKMRMLSDRAKLRRHRWMAKIDFEQEEECKLLDFITHLVAVIEQPLNDSLTYKVNFFDFRGEKGRDKSLDTVPGGFKVNKYISSAERADEVH